MKDFFKLRESLQTNEMYADYKSSPGYNDNDHKQFSHHKGDDKRSIQYRKAEHEVSHKHGSDAHAIGHHKGDTAVEHEKSHRDFSGSSSSDHSHHAVVHHDGTHTNISLPNSKKATAAHVTKQSKKVHPNLAADIAHNHNEINFHESVQIQEKNWGGYKHIKTATTTDYNFEKHDGVHHSGFPKGEKAHPKVIAAAKKIKHDDHSIDGMKFKGGHELHTHSHDEGDFVHIHHIHNGEHKGTYKYNTPHTERDKHPGEGPIKSALKHAPPHVIKAASQHLNNKEDELHGN